MEKLNVSSSLFENNGRIPNLCAGFGEDKSPDLCIGNIPEGTVTLAIVMDDLDHPIQPGYNHWVAWNIPPVDKIPESLPAGEVIEEPIHIEQGVGYGKHCYRGPKPPFNQCHRYVFTVYALNDTISLSPKANKTELMKKIEGHILAEGELVGEYRKKYK